MARKPRIRLSGALYHVILRGNQKQKIFLDEKDLKTFLSCPSDTRLGTPLDGTQSNGNS